MKVLLVEDDKKISSLKDGGMIDFNLTAENSRALFSISNTGPPIPDGDQPSVFNRFFRVDASHSKRMPGSGLGLSLAREIVLAYGGGLILSESSAGGTTFSLSLPCMQ